MFVASMVHTDSTNKRNSTVDNIPDGIETTLTAAAGKGNLRAVRYLIGCGVSVNQEERGFSPLMKSAFAGHTEVVCELLKCGAAADAVHYSSKRSALMLAALSGHLDTVKALAVQGLAQLNLQDSRGYTAFMLAVFKQHTAIIEFLASHMCSTGLKNWLGEKAQEFGGPNGATVIAAAVLKQSDNLEAISAMETGRELLRSLRTVFPFHPGLQRLVNAYVYSVW